MPAVTDLDDALAPGAPLLFEDLGSNVCGGNRGNPGDPLEDAEVIVRGRFVNQRVAVVPMEGGGGAPSSRVTTASATTSSCISRARCRT